MKTEKNVVLLSGGMDSTTLLYDLWKDTETKHEIHVLSIDYGQRHKVELEIARKHVQLLRDTQTVMSGTKSRVEELKYLETSRWTAASENLSKMSLQPTGEIVDHQIVKFDFSVFGGSPLTDRSIAVPTQSENKQETTVVPYRNTVLTTLASMYAHKVGATNIFISAVWDDLKAYPDCRPEYYESLQRTLRLGGTIHNLRIKVPYNESTKVDIVRNGLKLQVDYELTHTCYNGSQPPCLECDADRERMDAFAKNGVRDPLVSQALWQEYLTGDSLKAGVLLK